MITLMRTDRRKDTTAPTGCGSPLELELMECGRAGSSLRRALEEEGAAVRIVTPEELAERSSQEAPDLVLLGSQIDFSSTLRLMRELDGRGVPVLFLAPRADPELARIALDAGAADILPPPHSGQAILFRAAIVRNHHEAGREGRSEPRFGKRRLDRDGRRLTGRARPISLSGREFDLLDRLLKEEGGVVSREALLRDIWGEHQESEGVLEATVHRLRRKLEAEISEPRHLTTVRGVGYRLEPDGLRGDQG